MYSRSSQCPSTQLARLFVPSCLNPLSRAVSKTKKKTHHYSQLLVDGDRSRIALEYRQRYPLDTQCLECVSNDKLRCLRAIPIAPELGVYGDPKRPVPVLGLGHLDAALSHKRPHVFQKDRGPYGRTLCLRLQKFLVLCWMGYVGPHCHEPLGASIVAHGIQVFHVVVLETTEEKTLRGKHGMYADGDVDGADRRHA